MTIFKQLLLGILFLLLNACVAYPYAGYGGGYAPSSPAYYGSVGYGGGYYSGGNSYGGGHHHEGGGGGHYGGGQG